MKKDWVEQKKTYLYSYRALKCSIEIMVKLKKDIESELKSYSAIFNDELLESYINGQLNRLSSYIADSIIQKEQLCKMLLDDIGSMKCETEKNILILKYIHGYTWEQICGIINYSLRQTYNIYNKALKNFLDIHV